jgi:hypothetical protein
MRREMNRELKLGALRVRAGRRGRQTEVSLHCDAMVCEGGQILLVSAAGPQSAVKALAATLRGDSKVEYLAEVPEGDGSRHLRAERRPGGYRVHRTRLGADTWHVLCVAQVEGLLPVLSEETLWQALRSGRFSTPLLRGWAPWLMGRMLETGLLAGLEQAGCHAGLLRADADALDRLVSEGVRDGHLEIPGGSPRPARNLFEMCAEGLADVEGIGGYLGRYGPLLGRQAERSLDPLHVPGRDEPGLPPLLRQPFPAQAHVIAAVAKALRRQRAVLFVGEMGTGKTLSGMAAAHAHAAGRPYRALVFCPGQLAPKWQREIEETIPGAAVRQIESWRDLLALDRGRAPSGAEWFVIARDRAKLGARWRPAFLHRPGESFLSCPACGFWLVDGEGTALSEAGLSRRRQCCEHVLGDDDKPSPGCGSPLWQMTREIDRYEPALYVKRRLKGFFDYLICDEAHEEKSATSAQGNALGSLAAACKKTIALTGTLLNGYAESLRPLLFRLAPRSLVEEGLGWPDAMPFSERYGRIETRITEREGKGGEDNRESRGSTRSKTKSIRPGILPQLFGRHLIGKAVFLGLAEVADGLPPLSEECVAVGMDAEQARAYGEVEEALSEEIKRMIVRGDRRLLGAMLQTLLAYPDHPFGWGPVGYREGGEGGGGGCFVTVCTPDDLGEGAVRPKEQALIDLCLAERDAGRKVWVYVQFTDRHDVQGRVEKLLRGAGLRVGSLRAKVPLAKREEWIAKNAPKCDVLVSHPRLVETGLDFFDRAGTYVVPTVVFYEQGYLPNTLRQASRRAWRIGQTMPCRVVHLYYRGTLQERAVALMGEKLAAAVAIEGRFGGEGLIALAGDDAGPTEMALARSLAERLDDGAARRAWAKVTAVPAPPRAAPKRQRATAKAPRARKGGRKGPR